MCKVAVVTNRHLCREDFLVRIERLAAGGADRIILREKDMTADAYEQLAEKVLHICERYHTECILHTFTEVCRRLSHPYIHLPLSVMQSIRREAMWQTVGASVHSTEEARQAQSWGVDYITAGHIFETDCKRGVAGRGTAFIKEVCDAAHIPVWAIGGISAETIGKLDSIGIEGVCIMSSAMKTKNPTKMIGLLKGSVV